MKKKRISLALIVLVFILGMIAANQNNYSRSQYFEQNKEEFESEIQKPNNNYKPKQVTPEPSFTTKAAQKIDEKISGACQSIIKKIASLFDE